MAIFATQSKALQDVSKKYRLQSMSQLTHVAPTAFSILSACIANNVTDRSDGYVSVAVLHKRGSVGYKIV